MLKGKEGVREVMVEEELLEEFIIMLDTMWILKMKSSNLRAPQGWPVVA